VQLWLTLAANRVQDSGKAVLYGFFALAAAMQNRK
jgi:hypothetical protein